MNVMSPVLQLHCTAGYMTNVNKYTSGYRCGVFIFEISSTWRSKVVVEVGVGMADK